MRLYTPALKGGEKTMKRILGTLVAFAFVVAASAVYAETKAAPTNVAPTATPTPTVANNEVKKDAKTLATESCTKKNLVGTALDECVKNELAKVNTNTAKTPDANLATTKPEAPKTK